MCRSLNSLLLKVAFEERNFTWKVRLFFKVHIQWVRDVDSSFQSRRLQTGSEDVRVDVAQVLRKSTDTEGFSHGHGYWRLDVRFRRTIR